MSNVSAKGAAQAKTGWQATPLDRGNGYNKTMTAMDSKTKSRYPHMDRHYQYEDVGGKNNGCCNEHGHEPV